MTAHPHAGKSFFPDLPIVTRPRHYTLFALEPLFALASLTVPLLPQTTQGPNREILDWLYRLVAFVDSVQAGPAEVEVDSGQRHATKIGYFKRILDRWEGRAVEETEVDGSLWEKGWRDWSRLAWAMI
jgi:hypothetical protein